MISMDGYEKVCSYFPLPMNNRAIKILYEVILKAFEAYLMHRQTG